jgi:SWI/SNF-related matrix-associated actin-dependent regulator 1 of chromatin subfamily A
MRIKLPAQELTVPVETPMPYQEIGAAFLAERKHALLADRMGLGKSCQAILACDMIGAKRILVICPAIARDNWSREFTRFSPMDRTVTIFRTGKDKPSETGVNITSFDLASDKKVRSLLMAKRFDVLIVDEAHFIKSRKASRTKVIYGAYCNGIKGLSGNSDYVWRLTGTPFPNNAAEIWTHLASAGKYKGNYYEFERTFCAGYQGDYGFVITGNRNVTALQNLLEDFMIRRTELKGLPPLTINTVVVPAGKVCLETHYIMDVLTEGKSAVIAEIERQAHALQASLSVVQDTYNDHETIPLREEKSLQIIAAMGTSAAKFRKYVGLAKVPAVVETVVGELQEDRNKKIVIFAYHKSVIDQLSVDLDEFKPVKLFGGTPADRRQTFIDRFNDPNSSCRVFIGQVLAAGTAINLTVASDLIFVEQDYVPGNNAQAVMRCHRIGQDKPVRVRIFALADTIDERIEELLRKKMKTIAEIIS